jgi:prepilin-type N-terminal cleavage/methylation domain-containing protein
MFETKTKLKKFYFQNQQGFTLIEVFITLGLISIVGLAVANMTASAINGQMRAEVLSDLNQKTSELSMLLSNSKSCKAILGEHVNAQNWQNLISSNGLELADDQPLRMNGNQQPIIQKGLKSGKILVDNIFIKVIDDPISEVTSQGKVFQNFQGNLKVHFANTEPGRFGFTGKREKDFPIMFSVEKNVNNLHDCFEVGMSNESLAKSCEMLGGTFATIDGKPTCNALNPLEQQIMDQAQRLDRQIETTRNNLETISNQIRNESVRLNNAIENNRRDLASTDARVNEIQNILNQTNRNVDVIVTNLGNAENQINNQRTQLVNLENQAMITNNQITNVNNNINRNETLITQLGSSMSSYMQVQNSQMNIMETTINNLYTNVYQLQTIINNFNSTSCPLGRNSYGNCNVPEPVMQQQPAGGEGPGF